MIPDNTFIFKQYGVPRNFDDHTVRLHQHVQQDTMPMLVNGRHLLFVCPVCLLPWYKTGRQEFPRLSPEQLALLGETMHIEIHQLHFLPRALCSICSAIYLGGVFSVEEYPQHGGYRFLWECASPRRLRLQALVYRRDGCTLDGLVPLLLETLACEEKHVRSVLAWLEGCPFPENMRAWPNGRCQQSPFSSSPEIMGFQSAYQWRGYAWDVFCPPLGGDALVSVAVAGGSGTLVSLTNLYMSWSILARVMRTVL
jgi:hypothetical protein